MVAPTLSKVPSTQNFETVDSLASFIPSVFEWPLRFCKCSLFRCPPSGAHRQRLYPTVHRPDFTAEGTANILGNKYIPVRGCPIFLLTDNKLQFCPKILRAVKKLIVINKISMSSYHPNGNGAVKRVNYTMVHMLSMVVNERQNDRGEHLPNVQFAYNNSVSAATGLAPNKVHIDRLSRLPLTNV